MGTVMLRCVFFLVLALAAPSFSFAAETGPSRLLGKNEILRGRFVQEHPVKGLANPVRSEGRFVVAPGRGMIWAVEKPLPSSFVFTSGGMLHMIGDLPLLFQSSQQRPFLGQAPDLITAALGGNWKALETDFDLKRSGGQKLWQVKIVPRPVSRLRPPFKSVTASGTSFVERAEVLRHDGLSDSFAFSQQQLDGGGLTASEANAFSIPTGP